MQEWSLFAKGECREKETHGLLLGNRALKGVSSRNVLNQGILSTNFAYSLMLNNSQDMGADKCELSYLSLTPSSTNARQCYVHVVGHLMYLIHLTNKAAVRLLDYHFSLGLGVCLEGLSPDPTHRSCLYSCSAAFCEGTMDRVGIQIPRGHLTMLQLQKAICPWEPT